MKKVTVCIWPRVEGHHLDLKRLMAAALGLQIEFPKKINDTSFPRRKSPPLLCRMW